jgi:glycosyltransferase involved in cell wall biosynthesis
MTMDRKKILWLCSWYPSKTDPFNGDFVQRHARAAAMYNDIYVIYVAGDATGRIKEVTKDIRRSEGLTEHLVYFKKTNSLWGRVKANYQWYFLMKQAVRKYMVENKKPDLAHVHIPYKAAMAGNWLKDKYKVPFVLSEHWGIYNDVEILNYQGRSSVFKKFTRKAFTAAAACTSVSRYLADGVNRLVAKVPFTIIPNATDTRIFYYRERAAAVFQFIHVSNMVPLKNAEGILRAFKLLLDNGAGAALRMVGNPDSSMAAYAASIGIPADKVSFTGEVPYGEVAGLMQDSDCLLVYSNIENSPCVIGEALCCGLPVIATATGGIPELVDDANAMLVEPGNDTGLMQKMRQMMENYQQYNRKQIAEKAKNIFSYEAVGKMFDVLYDTIKDNN